MINYQEKTLFELHEIARNKKIPGWSGMTRNKLVEILEREDKDSQLEDLYEKAKDKGIQGYTRMSETKLKRKLEEIEVLPFASEEPIEERTEEGDVMAQKKKKSKRNNMFKDLIQDIDADDAPTPKKKKSKRISKKTKIEAPTRAKKSNPVDSVAENIVDFKNIGYQAASEIIKTSKSLTFEKVSEYKRAILKKLKLTGNQREDFNGGWGERFSREI